MLGLGGIQALSGEVYTKKCGDKNILFLYRCTPTCQPTADCISSWILVTRFAAR